MRGTCKKINEHAEQSAMQEPHPRRDQPPPPPGRRLSGLTYVASACTNCVRVHAACDRQLPCQ